MVKSFLNTGIKSRGLRNNNPGNIRLNSANAWVGKVPDRQNTDGAFEQFTELRYGFRALIKLLRNYMERDGLRTVRGIISKYAPPNENDTGHYYATVSARTGLGLDERVGPSDKNKLVAIAHAIAYMENRADEMVYVTKKDVLDGWALLESEGTNRRAFRTAAAIGGAVILGGAYLIFKK